MYKWTHAIHTCVFQGPAVHKALETPFKILYLLFSTLSIELNKKPKPQYPSWHFFFKCHRWFCCIKNPHWEQLSPSKVLYCMKATKSGTLVAPEVEDPEVVHTCCSWVPCASPPNSRGSGKLSVRTTRLDHCLGFIKEQRQAHDVETLCDLLDCSKAGLPPPRSSTSATFWQPTPQGTDTCSLSCWAGQNHFLYVSWLFIHLFLRIWTIATFQ